MPTYKRIDEQELLIGCNCHAKEHLVSFAVLENSLDRKNGDNIPDDFYFGIKIDPYLGFFKRIFIGIKYIFRPRYINKTGEFNCVLLNIEDVVELKNFCNKYIENNSKFFINAK